MTSVKKGLVAPRRGLDDLAHLAVTTNRGLRVWGQPRGPLSLPFKFGSETMKAGRLYDSVQRRIRELGIALIDE